MASYRLEWRKSTKKDLRGIPPREVVKIIGSSMKFSQSFSSSKSSE